MRIVLLPLFEATPIKPATGSTMSSSLLPEDHFLEPPMLAELGAIVRTPVDLEVVIPAYNEERRLPRTVERTAELLAARPWRSRIVVVDNGSVDATPAVGQQGYTETHGVPLCVIGCAAPGKGAAVRRGVLSSRADFIGYMDADLATPIEALDGVMANFLDGADVVVASRRAPGARFEVTPTHIRRLGTILFSGIGRQLVPGISDTQCGFKFFRGEVGHRILGQCQTNGFAFDLELLALAIREKYDVRELPVFWRAQPGSTFRILRDGVPSFASALHLLSRMGRTAPRATAHG